MSLQHRNLVPELMDDPDLDPRAHEQALAGLRRVNFWSGTSQRLAKTILEKCLNRQQIRVLDLGSGGGEVAAGVFSRLVATGRECHFEGWDFSPTAVELANRVHARKQGKSVLRFEQANAFASLEERADRFDFIYCSLFLHHFENRQAVELLARMRERAMVLVIVDDLIRSPAGYWLAQFGCHLLSRSPIVHFDGPQSVRAAFSVAEISEVADKAQMTDFQISRHWPQRFMLQWCAS